MNPIEKEWKILLEKIIESGKVHIKDDAKIIEVLGYHTFVKNPMTGFIGDRSAKSFLTYVKGGAFNVNGYPMSGESISKYLEECDDYKCLNPSEFKDGFVYTYPERLFNMTYPDSFMVNQFGVMVDRLTAVCENEDGELDYCSGSNRAVACLYSAHKDCDKKDIPCLNWLQATIRDNELTLHVMFRSNDIYGAWVSNMFFITYIGLRLVDVLKKSYPSLEFKGIDYHVSSAHIYKTDMRAAKKILGV